LLAVAALEAGLFPQSLPDFGAERSGAPIACYTRIDTGPPVIRGPVSQPDAVVVLDPSLVGPIDVLEGAREGAPLIINTIDTAEAMKVRAGRDDIVCCAVDGSGIGARRIGRPIPNVPLLGAFVRVVPIMKIETVRKVLVSEMARRFSPEIVEGNEVALMEGYELSHVAGE
jgi:pyruvate ferredoxin oxidoreductase gamma subunit